MFLSEAKDRVYKRAVRCVLIQLVEPGFVAVVDGKTRAGIPAPVVIIGKLLRGRGGVKENMPARLTNVYRRHNIPGGRRGEAATLYEHAGNSSAGARDSLGHRLFVHDRVRNGESLLVQRYECIQRVNGAYIVPPTICTDAQGAVERADLANRVADPSP